MGHCSAHHLSSFHRTVCSQGGVLACSEEDLNKQPQHTADTLDRESALMRRWDPKQKSKFTKDVFLLCLDVQKESEREFGFDLKEKNHLDCRQKLNNRFITQRNAVISRYKDSFKCL